jgi:hypothetical protein
MIITKLIGGLGNQMFQFGAGLALAKKWHVPLKIDVSHLNADPNGAYTPRQLELTIFDYPFEIATQKDIDQFQETTLSKILYKYFKMVSKYQVANESGQTLNSQFFHLPANTYLNGFWQNEAYFDKVSIELRKAFTFKKEIITSSTTLKNQLKPVSVSLHVRRGDYVTLASANQFHGLCSVDYYVNAVNFLKAQLQTELVIYVFSDDVPWCKTNIPIQNCHFLETTSAAQDLYLMSQCQHHIIANSSFSWWAAWLNANPSKHVVAPKYWFNGVESKTLGIIPKTWHCIE